MLSLYWFIEWARLDDSDCIQDRQDVHFLQCDLIYYQFDPLSIDRDFQLHPMPITFYA